MTQNYTLHCARADAGALVVRLAGDWRRVDGAIPLATVRQALADGGANRLMLDAGAVTAWDTSLPVFVRAVVVLAHAIGGGVETRDFPPGAAALLRLADAAPGRADTACAPARESWLAGVGRGAMAAWDDAVDTVTFLGESIQAFGRMLRGRARWRRADLWAVIQECGPAALPIVTVISLLVGTILAFLGALQLKMFGAEIYIADLVGVGMAREMGALMTGIIMAGRTGASFAARLGTMQVNEEIDALRTLGFDPMEFLVLPRALALILMLPLLTCYANFLGMLGGGLAGIILFDLTPAQYFHQTVNAVTIKAVISGLIKSAVYGVLIALSGCMRGMRCGRSAAAVGDATTTAVVNAIVYIIVADAVLSIIYTMIKF